MLKYPKVDPDIMKRQIIPEAADYCAKERAKHLWNARQYRQCLSAKIRALIKEKSPY